MRATIKVLGDGKVRVSAGGVATDYFVGTERGRGLVRVFDGGSFPQIWWPGGRAVESDRAGLVDTIRAWRRAVLRAERAGVR